MEDWVRVCLLDNPCHMQRILECYDPEWQVPEDLVRVKYKFLEFYLKGSVFRRILGVSLVLATNKNGEARRCVSEKVLDQFQFYSRRKGGGHSVIYLSEAPLPLICHNGHKENMVKSALKTG